MKKLQGIIIAASFVIFSPSILASDYSRGGYSKDNPYTREKSSRGRGVPSAAQVLQERAYRNQYRELREYAEDHYWDHRRDRVNR